MFCLLVGYLEGDGRSALFDFIYGLAQINSQHYIVAERFNHCLRNIQEFTWKTEDNKWETSTYAGRCTFAHKVDGPLQNARFRHPIFMVKANEILLLTELKVETIRRIDMVTGTVSSIFQSNFATLRGLAVGEKSNEYYATTNHGVLHIIDEKESWLVGSLTDGSRVGKFSEAEFDTTANIEWVDSATLIVSDSDNHSLKVINLDTEEVYPICVGKS